MKHSLPMCPYHEIEYGRFHADCENCKQQANTYE